MTIISVVGEEALYLYTKLFNVLIGLLVCHSVKHRHWSQPFDFSQVTEHTQLSIGQAHVVLVSLLDLPFF